MIRICLPSLLILSAALLSQTRPTQAGKSGSPGAKPVLTGSAHLDKAFGGFGNDGTVSGNIGPGDDEIEAIAIQPWDGRIVAVGTSQGDFAVSRYLRDGSIDTSFDGDGKTTIDFDNQDDHGTAVAIQPDGKIVAAGYSMVGNDLDFSLARLDPDGGLDSGFGPDGKVTTGFGGNDGAFSVAIQPDGKIVAGGESRTCELVKFLCDTDFALARYTANGALDPSFGMGGKATSGLGGDEFITHLVIQDDGKIVAGGPKDSNQIAIVRYLANGLRDTSFDNDGLLSTDKVGAGHWIDVQPDHKILLFGQNGLFRLTDLGWDDHTFGNAGFVPTSSTGLADFYRGIVLPDGNIVVAGSGPHTSFDLARFDPDGNLDMNFGESSGITRNRVPVSSSNIANLLDLIRTPDGELMAAGSTHPEGGEKSYAMARYLPDGTLDDGGRVITRVTDFAGIDDQASAIAVGKNGSILLAGSANTGPLKRAGAARYTQQGQLDEGFASHGLLRSGVLQKASAAAVDGNGFVYLAGPRYASATGFDFALLKFKPDGSSLAAGFGPSGTGFVTTDLGGDDTPNALALTPDGGFAVAGSSGLDFAVVKYTLGGLPDPSFDVDGIVTTGFSPNSVDVAYAALSQPDGKILVAGRTKASGSENDDFALARYNPDGSLDPSFDGDGLLAIDFAGEPDTAYDLALTQDGKILVAGTAEVAGTGHLAAARLNPDGSLDTSFSEDGKVLLHHGLGDNTGYAAGVLPNGEVAIAGCLANFDLGYNQMLLDVLNPDGTPDSSFATNGTSTYSLGGASCAYDLAASSTRILLAGFASNGSNDNYALVDVSLVQPSPFVLKPLIFLPDVSKGQ